MPNKLQYVELPIIAREECQADYEGINGVTEGKKLDYNVETNLQMSQT